MRIAEAMYGKVLSQGQANWLPEETEINNSSGRMERIIKRFCQQWLLDIFIFVYMKEAEENFCVLVHLHS